MWCLQLNIRPKKVSKYRFETANNWTFKPILMNFECQYWQWIEFKKSKNNQRPLKQVQPLHLNIFKWSSSWKLFWITLVTTSDWIKCRTALKHVKYLRISISIDSIHLEFSTALKPLEFSKICTRWRTEKNNETANLKIN